MKNLYILGIILLTSASLCTAQGGKGYGGGMGAQHGKITTMEGETHRMSNLRAFLSMSDEQLERVEAAIREIREMSPEEKEALRTKLDAYENLPKRQRESMNQAWGQLDQKIKDAWRTYVDGLEQSELDKLRDKMDSMSHMDRFEYRLNLLRENGLIEKE